MSMVFAATQEAVIACFGATGAEQYSAIRSACARGCRVMLLETVAAVGAGVLVLAGVLYALLWQRKVPEGARVAPLIPTYMAGLDLLVRSVISAAQHREIEFIDYMLDVTGANTVRASLFGADYAVMFTSEPDVIMHVTAKNFGNWIKGPNLTVPFYELLGTGIFNTNDDTWKLHRDIARPHFARDELTGYVEAFNEHFGDLEVLLERACKSGETVDMWDVFQRFTMDSFVHLFFGHELRSLRAPSEFTKHFDYAQSFVSWRMRLDPFWKLLPKVFTGRFNTSIEYIDKFVLQLIDEARHDLLAHYLNSQDLDGQPFTDEYLRDMLVNFLLAGRDTTAALLMWTTYMLSLHPEVERKLVEEIDRVVGPDRFPTAEDIKELRYAKLVLNETLRLYPSVPFNIRTARDDDVLPNGVFVPKGTDVFFCTFRMQRDKTLWGPTADQFDPERYVHAQEAGQKYPTNPCAFLPFHAGPRICLGQNMAYTEARVALVRLYQKFHLRHDATTPVAYKTDIILTAAHGMRMHVEKRQ
eukprot:Unigene1116_Nuclearia_a/m.3552 Unigene1116_Nuclearia_a/g.3552  ORF Unigene1116_Nuclearia_a/g.3552 Unigene1116_Nuclearia_a/m.3552 type:complete len:528 (+) Unigene1116_Nuclearia_a:2046-3629(+)